MESLSLNRANPEAQSLKPQYLPKAKARWHSLKLQILRLWATNLNRSLTRVEKARRITNLKQPVVFWNQEIKLQLKWTQMKLLLKTIAQLGPRHQRVGHLWKWTGANQMTTLVHLIARRGTFNRANRQFTEKTWTCRLITRAQSDNRLIGKAQTTKLFAKSTAERNQSCQSISIRSRNLHRLAELATKKHTKL